jgi:hypothetical protein
MKQHVELAIIVSMAAMMVFGAAALVMPYVYALSSSSSTGSGGSGTSGASGAAATGSKPGAGGAGDNKGSTTSSGGSTGGGSTGGGSTGGSSSPPPVSKPPPKPPSKVPFCKPGSCLGTPHYYTLVGHHHCYDGYPGCVCNSSKAACGANYGKP